MYIVHIDYPCTIAQGLLTSIKVTLNFADTQTSTCQGQGLADTQVDIKYLLKYLICNSLYNLLLYSFNCIFTACIML